MQRGCRDGQTEYLSKCWMDALTFYTDVNDPLTSPWPPSAGQSSHVSKHDNNADV